MQYILFMENMETCSWKCYENIQRWGFSWVKVKLTVGLN
jgi:hypothetical protein